MHIDEAAFEKLLLDSALVNKATLKELKTLALEKGMSLGAASVMRGVLTEEDVRRMHAYLLGTPFVDLKNRKIDFATFSLIPEPVARNHNVIAFNKVGDGLEVALLDISDLAAVEFVRRKAGVKLLPRLTDSESMKWALLSYQKILKSELGDLIQDEVIKLKDDRVLAPGLVDALLKHALLQGASDVHIEPHEDHSLVRYRIGGLLRDTMVLSSRAASAVARTLSELGGVKNDELVRDGRFRIETGSENVYCRFSILPVEGGERTVIRLVRSRSIGFSLEGLGLEVEAVEELHHALARGRGLILTSGPAKSGKTTTLYTMLDLLNTPEVSLMTIEDEIESRLPHVNQSRVNSKIGFTYPHALRTLLTQDPDVIMIGNIGDAETATLALAAAKQRLVLASLEAASPEMALSHLSSLVPAPEHLEPLHMLVFHHPVATEGVRRTVLQFPHGKTDFSGKLEELSRLS